MYLEFNISYISMFIPSLTNSIIIDRKLISTLISVPSNLSAWALTLFRPYHLNTYVDLTTCFNKY